VFSKLESLIFNLELEPSLLDWKDSNLLSCSGLYGNHFLQMSILVVFIQACIVAGCWLSPWQF